MTALIPFLIRSDFSEIPIILDNTFLTMAQIIDSLSNDASVP